RRWRRRWRGEVGKMLTWRSTSTRLTFCEAGDAMSAQIVFLTLFLGIVGGVHPVSLEVIGPIKTVRMTLGEREVAVLTQPPWRATIEMGPTLVPRELTAIGFD